ncbi:MULTISPECIES: OmpH family outer membrane protein [Tenacibaculum]|uniref:OmpH family outer membrane protein n=1 Tax=Tenacibaculum TaxID=104267 RepID=UPI00089B28C6|nr:OmpH family outer membrane protein [Tenacibaculum sp. MAR_2010_89]SEE41529.1 periplasmic chaperone for outer membrane proteins Skp [Tenacibaculum sp. MAR_2010_89]
MKLKITFFITIFFIGLASAQTKVGTVNSDLIIGKMPQMKSVIKRLENYSKELDSSFQLKAKTYQSKIEAFKKVEKTITDNDRKTKIQELAAIEQDMAKFRKNGSTMMQLRRDEYMRPLYRKLNEIVKEVAKANGYSQVLTTNGNEFAYIDDRYDITKLVLSKLGIKE